MPEFVRKFFVALKRKPQNIPLVMVAVAFIWYSLNLTVVSYTTTRLQGNNMGLTGFAIMLFSALAFVCCLNAFPYRKKVKIPMLILLFVMLALLMVCDIHYLNCIIGKLADPAVVITPESLPEVYQARKVIEVHIIMLIVCWILVATLPEYTYWIRKIRTSVEVAENAEMEAIDISGEE